jgi:hypothetical protein
MKTRLKTTTLAALPFAGWLFTAPVGSAHGEQVQEHRAEHRDLNAAHEATHEGLNAEHRAGHRDLEAEHRDYHDFTD